MAWCRVGLTNFALQSVIGQSIDIVLLLYTQTVGFRSQLFVGALGGMDEAMSPTFSTHSNRSTEERRSLVPALLEGLNELVLQRWVVFDELILRAKLVVVLEHVVGQLVVRIVDRRSVTPIDDVFAYRRMLLEVADESVGVLWLVVPTEVAIRTGVNIAVAETGATHTR